MKEIFGSIFTDVYENNRVRVNLLTSIYGITDELLRDHSVQDHAALRQLLQDIFALADIPKPSANESTISYINWTEKEKTELARKISARLSELLRAISTWEN
jgi:hypothetical protein